MTNFRLFVMSMGFVIAGASAMLGQSVENTGSRVLTDSGAGGGTPPAAGEVVSPVGGKTLSISATYFDPK